MDEELRSTVEDDEISQENASGSGSESETPRTTSPSRKHLRSAAATSQSINSAGSPEGPVTAPGEPQPEGDIASNLRITHEADKKKGRAVSRQIVSPFLLPRLAAFSYRLP